MPSCSSRSCLLREDENPSHWLPVPHPATPTCTHRPSCTPFGNPRVSDVAQICCQRPGPTISAFTAEVASASNRMPHPFLPVGRRASKRGDGVRAGLAPVWSGREFCRRPQGLWGTGRSSCSCLGARTLRSMVREGDLWCWLRDMACWSGSGWMGRSCSLESGRHPTSDRYGPSS